MLKRFVFFQVVFCLGLVSIVFGCNRNDVYNRYIDINMDHGWNKDSVIIFQFAVSDTVAAYDLDLEVRNTSEYPYENLWVYCQLSSIDSLSTLIPVDITLADKQGKWYGHKWGNFYTIQTPIYKNKTFNSSQEMKLIVQHGIRDINLKGIGAIGLRITRHQ